MTLIKIGAKLLIGLTQNHLGTKHMSIGLTTAFPQMSTKTDSVYCTIINVEGFFQVSEDENANGKDMPGKIWRFTYDIGGLRKQLIVINPSDLTNDDQLIMERNRYYRVIGYSITPDENISYLYFTSGTKT